MKSREDMMEKIKGLLALGDPARNSNEQEAQASMLKAQELMAKYDISVQEVEEVEEEKYSNEVCEHRWNYAYRIPLAAVLAPNFKCRLYNHGNNIVFMGHSADAKICKATFEFAYMFIMKKGNQLYNQRYSMGLPTKGVFNSYANGFICGIKNALDAQCVSLAIVTPKDVNDKFEEMSKNWKTKKSRSVDVTDAEVWRRGKEDGKSFMKKDALPE